MTTERTDFGHIWAEDIENMKRIVDLGFNINKTYPYPMECKVR